MVMFRNEAVEIDADDTLRWWARETKPILLSFSKSVSFFLFLFRWKLNVLSLQLELFV